MLVIILSVPEGLPMVLTLSLAYSVHEMQKEDILVRKLNTCYVMGGANNLMLDKTGTMTKCNLRVT
jgi:P-type E1-E2 ATPase